MDTSLVVISIIRLYNFNIAASWNLAFYRIVNFYCQLFLFLFM